MNPKKCKNKKQDVTRSSLQLQPLRSKPTNHLGENKSHKTPLLRLYRQETLAVSHHFNKFDDNRYCDKSDFVMLSNIITLLNAHMTFESTTPRRTCFPNSAVIGLT